MFLKYIFYLFVGIAGAVKTPQEEDFYYASVVEYSPLPGKDGKEVLMKNAREFVSLIKIAAEHADIIVFPEEGLLNLDHSYSTYVEVPFGNDTLAPADNKTADPALQMISLAARSNGIYVVINLREKYNSGTEILHYNTDVIFDRNGKVIGRYRKTHLFGENLNTTSTVEHVFFDSDFGVRFGIFTCFDITFEDPALVLIKNKNVTDILYPTWWFSSLPFLTAIQTQSAWSYANDVNLLAAGGNHVSRSTTGSGIYAGKRGPIVYLQSQRNETSILVAKLYKKDKHGTSVGKKLITTRMGDPEKLNLWDDPVMKLVKSVIINPEFSSAISLNKIFLQNLCHDGFCCDFHLNITFNNNSRNFASSLSDPLVGNDHYIYRIAVFNGIQKYYLSDVGVQLCGVISCLNTSITSCGKQLKTENSSLQIYSTVFNEINITASSIEKGSLSLPVILESSNDKNVFGSLMNVSDYSFSVQDYIGRLTLSSDKLISASIYVRVFSRDIVSSSNYIFSSALYVLIGSSIFLYFYYYNEQQILN